MNKKDNEVEEKWISSIGSKCGINKDERWERHYWSLKWGISEDQLLLAIEKTGSTRANILEKYLSERDMIA